MSKSKQEIWLLVILVGDILPMPIKADGAVQC